MKIGGEIWRRSEMRRVAGRGGVLRVGDPVVALPEGRPIGRVAAVDPEKVTLRFEPPQPFSGDASRIRGAQTGRAKADFEMEIRSGCESDGTLTRYAPPARGCFAGRVDRAAFLAPETN